MKILGVDVGLTGACAVVEIRADGPHVVAVIDMPVTGVGARRRVDAVGLQEWLLETGPNHAIVEASQAFPRQGVASVFRYGRAAGVAEGIIAACGISIEHVSPARWKRAFNLSANKEASRALAIARFPDAHAYFARKRDHGAAEACLLALYGAQTVPRIKPDIEAPATAEVAP
jgi:crossover junction endodeoxyribonuclease RuvC